MKSLISHPIKNAAEGLKGAVRVPGDKSISHRALMLGAAALGVTRITGLLESEDVLRTARALISLGIQVVPPASKDGIWTVSSIGESGVTAPRSALYFGNSGTAARLMMGLIAGYPISASFLGDTALNKRPMGRVIKPLAQMGAHFEMSSADRLPLRITGSSALRPIHYELPTASAQVKSAILLAALRAKGGTEIIEPTPTRDHTERLMRHMGATVLSEPGPNGSSVVTIIGFPNMMGCDITIPSDPSSAAFLTVAALITPGSEIVIPNVGINPLRTGLFTTLIEMGGDIVFENKRETSSELSADIRVKYSQLKGVRVPKERVIAMMDEFPILSVAAAFAEGETEMSNLADLRLRDSDRLNNIAEGLKTAGVTLTVTEDSLKVSGSGKPPAGGCLIKVNMDHRIAMSFLVMGLAAEFPIAIDESDFINISFPGFTALLNSLGADIRAENLPMNQTA